MVHTKYVQNLEGWDKLYSWEQEHVSKTLSKIKAGKMLASVVSVSKSGMSRRIKFYYIHNGELQNATSAVKFLRQAGAWDYDVIDKGFRVGGCGMDMIFHTLYCCVPYKNRDKWNQNYRTI